jgi:hypothetical protein
MENKEIIEMIKDAAFFGGNIQNENLEECRNFFDNVIEKQLILTDVSNRRELLIATLHGWQDYKDQGISIEDYVDEIESNL